MHPDLFEAMVAHVIEEIAKVNGPGAVYLAIDGNGDLVARTGGADSPQFVKVDRDLIQRALDRWDGGEKPKTIDQLLPNPEV